MIILLTNDDGIHAQGLRALKEALSGLGDIRVIAPATEQSGVSNAFSLVAPLRVEEITDNGKLFGHAVSGTPADAVKLALRNILPEKPALIVSGINRGENSGINILYSGTVAGAMEGAIVGIPSIAVSITNNHITNYDFCGVFSRKLCTLVLKNGLPHGTMLNVNIPPLPEKEIKGVRITHQADSYYQEVIQQRKDPRGVQYYWIGGTMNVLDDGEGSDVKALREGFVSITPLHPRMTNYEYIPVLSGWNLE